MYIYIVRRTQIYLTEDLDLVLERTAKASGVTKSQLIRDAVEEKYLRGTGRAQLLRALTGSAGAWRRRETGEAYVERLRLGRLARLHAPER
jgi:hypothetical protein